MSPDLLPKNLQLDLFHRGVFHHRTNVLSRELDICIIRHLYYKTAYEISAHKLWKIMLDVTLFKGQCQFCGAVKFNCRKDCRVLLTLDEVAVACVIVVAYNNGATLVIP